MLLLLGLNSCLDKIELDADTPPQENIVIQGRLVMDARGSRVRVNVSRLFDFTAVGTRPIYGSEIMMFDEFGNQVILSRLARTEDFHYEFSDSDPMTIQIGDRYQIKVTLPDGRNYESDFDRLLPLPNQSEVRGDSIELPVPNATGELVPGDFLSIYTNTDVRLGDGTPSMTKWEIEDCGFNLFIRGLPFELLNGARFASDKIENFHLFDAYLVEFTPGDGYCYHIRQESITESTHKYWSEVREVSERIGNLYEPPAGPVSGNISRTDDPSERVYGHFYATQERTKTLSK